jgi:hypothetical protein
VHFHTCVKFVFLILLTYSLFLSSNLKILDTKESVVKKCELDDVNSNCDVSSATLNSAENEVQPVTSDTAANTKNEELLETVSNGISSHDGVSSPHIVDQVSPVEGATVTDLLDEIDGPCDGSSSLAEHVTEDLSEYVTDKVASSDSLPNVDVIEHVNGIQEPCVIDKQEISDDKNKPSLEMFSSEVDAISNEVTAAECGSLELLCENDDDVESNGSRECDTPAITSSELPDMSCVPGLSVTDSALADTRTNEMHAEQPAKQEVNEISSGSSIDTLAKMSMDLEIMSVCDSSVKEIISEHSNSDEGTSNESSVDTEVESAEHSCESTDLKENFPAEGTDAGDVTNDVNLNAQDAAAAANSDALTSTVEIETPTVEDDDVTVIHDVDLSCTAGDDQSVDGPVVRDTEAFNLTDATITNIPAFEYSGDKFISEEESSFKGGVCF